MKKSTLVLIVLAAVVALWIFRSYNSMVEKRESVSTSWASVETQYQRRADLIPNLVNTVKGYADFEQETLTKVIEARAKATQTTIDPSNMTTEQLQQFQANQGELSSALSRLLVTIERYPELKANQNFLELQAQLEGTENRISVARNNFNGVAQGYNTYIKKLPQALVAGMLGFDAKPYFEGREGSEDAPVVEF
ncbi:MAG: LemA family protein [Bacteroidia bacterium]|nr:LemA family protein [Bacteroidia bacterium]